MTTTAHAYAMGTRASSRHKPELLPHLHCCGVGDMLLLLPAVLLLPRRRAGGGAGGGTAAGHCTRRLAAASGAGLHPSSAQGGRHVS